MRPDLKQKYTSLDNIFCYNHIVCYSHWAYLNSNNLLKFFKGQEKISDTWKKSEHAVMECCYIPLSGKNKFIGSFF